MGLASWVKGMLVNNHTKFGWNPLNNNEEIDNLKNFNLGFGYFLSMKGA